MSVHDSDMIPQIFPDFSILRSKLGKGYITIFPKLCYKCHNHLKSLVKQYSLKFGTRMIFRY